MPKKILIVSGEPSGDLHASNLVKNLKSLKPDIEFFGLGGALSKEAGVNTSFDISKLAVVALVDVLKNISVIGKVFTGLLSEVDSKKPDLAILVDYPGFNLRLAKELKKRGVPAIYYVSPQVWAWGENRIDIIKGCVEKIIVFFKFEEELYKGRGVNAEFVGHPLVDSVKASLSRDEVLKRYGLSGGKPVIALLPGSRMMEVKSLLKIMTGAAGIIDKKLGGAQFIIAKYKNLPIGLYADAVKDSGLDIRIAENDTHNVIGAADFAIVASGTATLETAMIGTPFIITYKAGLVNFLAYKIVARTKVLGLVNVLAKKVVVPELLQYNATPKKLAKAAIDIMRDASKRAAMLSEFSRIKSSLGAPGASMRAARAILSYLK